MHSNGPTWMLVVAGALVMIFSGPVAQLVEQLQGRSGSGLQFAFGRAFIAMIGGVMLVTGILGLAGVVAIG